MIYGSVCSGIEAASVAWKPLGWRAAFLSEIDAFPRAILRHHYPDVPLRGDFREIQKGDHEPIDLLVGGTPCQSFSVAGLRGGLADDRGNLALEYLRLADRLRPRWLLWENVPGVLSSTSHDAPDPCQPPDDMEEGSEWVGEDEYDADENHAFSCFLAGLSELGYGFAYRVFNAQFFGLAQRRERVFVVGYLGDWRRAAAVLFEPASLRGDLAPSREAREGVAPTISARPTAGGGLGTDFDLDGGLDALGGNNSAGAINVATAVNAHGGPHGRMDFESETFVTHALRADGFDASEDGTGRGTPLVPVSVALRGREGGGTAEMGDDLAHALRGSQGGGDKPHVLAFHGSQDPCVSGDVTHPVGSNHGLEACAHIGSAVRRLTPRECERLQGFPDIEKSVTILVCSSDRQKSCALAEIQSPRSRHPVWTVGDGVSQRNADAAEQPSSISLLGHEWPVALNVRIDFERKAVEISSRGRLLWSANDADEANWCLQLMRPGDFVRLAAPMMQTLVPIIHDGLVASPLNTPPFTHRWSGSALVPLCGAEIDDLVRDAARFTSEVSNFTKSITSEAGPNSPTYGRKLATWSSCVSAVISGFIPEEMRTASSCALNIEGIGGYTLIPWRGGLAPDGPRYKALGNSMAVPVMRWIGQRISAQSGK